VSGVCSENRAELVNTPPPKKGVGNRMNPD
jgi:hypothetical protein